MYYGIYGGRYVPIRLLSTLHELEKEYKAALKDIDFETELMDLLKYYVGRESPLYYAKRLSEYCNGARIYLKREDLNHTGAHKINNCIGQALLAKRMGKKRLIAETGAGMHGVATATVAALFGFECEIFMGALDVERQAPNVEKMEMLGAKVRSIHEGTQTLKDAMNVAIEEWLDCSDDTYYVIGTVAGPHPYPTIVKHFQSIIGKEARRQCLEQIRKLPKEVIACIGGGSNALGIFSGFSEDESVKLIGVEAGGKGILSGQHSASISGGKVGVLHGSKTYVLQDENGKVMNSYSISAGLDYPGVGPEHSYMADTGAAQYTTINDDEAVDAFDKLCRLEGIIPALESSHAIAYAMKAATQYSKDDIILVNLSGRGDKAIQTIRCYRSEHH